MAVQIKSQDRELDFLMGVGMENQENYLGDSFRMTWKVGQGIPDRVPLILDCNSTPYCCPV